MFVYLTYTSLRLVHNTRMFALANKLFTVIVEDRRYCDGEIMDVCSRMDVTQSEGDLLDSNQLEL